MTNVCKSCGVYLFESAFPPSDPDSLLCFTCAKVSEPQSGAPIADQQIEEEAPESPEPVAEAEQQN